ncbi:dna-directed dna polymerase : DNA polymerase OS=Meiothermus silvanus (strain ATCC 700542 / DSM 9946 / VI-R2) GN=Mesil_1349 PE=3 SV=1: DNA_pol_A_exo1: DNA_pol_A [Gemmata massiliana]|uniref:DNA polymerase I n=1 Tax=Gemmata massiliana TaxID=1210884 RepID=A0A6P2CZ68_9BACT|nr:DNA polymerase [Gemmata massiliana]VTR92510.1 dna-directed dna polymerase : DNA polymerase OS=Meiothermus silvanus (strain ATCC 700542 / DSM 9946 / VI-R2) GN=Mesil_1349 PE=3 SV=1: DNA_pol_A_exo1: DNA_pol_A [Gemmata massiliana]
MVKTAAGVEVIAAAVAEWSGPVALETTELDPTRDRVRLVQIGIGDEVALIDLFALSDPSADLAPLFAALAGKEVVGHNVQFDLRMLAPLGFVPGRVYDTMLASKVLHAGGREETNARLKHGLADVAERELGRELDKGEQGSDWSGQLSAKQLVYTATDAAVLLPLAAVLTERLAAAKLTETADREMRALPGIAWAELIAVDTRGWLALAAAAETERASLATAMDTTAPNPAGLPGMETRNWDSPTQVKDAFAQVGVTIGATDDDTLAGVPHPLAGMLCDYRAAAKRVGTYGRAWVEKHVGANDLVLPSWNQLGAESGRMSCSDPNLQQIPRGSEYRRCFVARPGRVLLKADYSQVELRIAAKVANEGVMIAAYRDGRDLHTLTAARVLNKPEADVTKADRQLAKAVNFGLLYGVGWRGLKQYAQANYGVALTDTQARGYREAFFRAYPAFRAWHARTEAHVKKLFDATLEGVHPVHTLGGRRRLLPVSKTGADGTRYPNKTDALNTPVQGTGADGLKVAIALLWERRDCSGAPVPVIFCHDEIVLEVPEAHAEQGADWLRGCMIEAVAPLIDSVPVEVEVTTGCLRCG